MTVRKVCMIIGRHSVFDARIYYKECLSLKKAGYEVHIIGRLGDENAFEDMGGNPVCYPSPQSHSTYYDGICLHGIKRKGKRPLRVFSEIFSIVKMGIQIDADVYHCHETDIALLATLIIKHKLRKKAKFIFDSHEFWSGRWAYSIFGNFYSVFSPAFVLLELILLKPFDGIIASDEPTKGLLQIYDLRRKVQLIYNSPSAELFDSGECLVSLPDMKGRTVLVHEGGISHTRCADIIIDFMLREKDKYFLLVLGNFEIDKDKDKDLFLKYKALVNANCIMETGFLPYRDVGKALELGDIGLVLLEDSPNYITAAPNKLFDYMYAGLPIVSFDFPGTRCIIEKYECGVILRDAERFTLLAAVNRLRAHPEIMAEMGKRGKAAAASELSWNSQSRSMLKLYEVLIKQVHYRDQIKQG